MFFKEIVKLYAVLGVNGCKSVLFPDIVSFIQKKRQTQKRVKEKGQKNNPIRGWGLLKNVKQSIIKALDCTSY